MELLLIILKYEFNNNNGIIFCVVEVKKINVQFNFELIIGIQKKKGDKFNFNINNIKIIKFINFIFKFLLIIINIMILKLENDWIIK